MSDGFRIKATSILGWPVWVTSIGEPIDVGGSMERPVKMVNAERKGQVFASREAAEQALQFVLKVRPDAVIVEDV